MRSTIAVTILAMGVCRFAPAQSVPLFSALQSSPSGLGASAPTFPAAGDFNGDGIPDVVVGDTASGTVNILLGDGAGGFQAARSFPVGTNPQCVAVGDFNGDGKLDVVVANGDSGGTISILFGNGDGTLQPAISIGVVANPNWVAVADFNGDGNLDIVVTGNDNLMVLLGNGFGGFSPLAPVTLLPAGTTTSTTTLPVVTGDVDGDGKQDLIVTGLGLTSFLAGNGDGTFISPVGIAPASFYPAALGDFNNDGRLDVAITTNGNDRKGIIAQLWIALNTGSGTFTLQAVAGFGLPTGGADSFVGNPVAADFNGDGNLDIIVKDIATNVFVFLGNGDGSVQAAGAQAQMPSNFSAQLLVADFDRNGSPDLLQPETDSVAVLRNTGGNPPLPTLLTLTPAVVQSGGVSVAQGTVLLGSAAPPSGAVVALNIADPTAASLGSPTVFVQPGTSSVTFQIFANAVDAQVSTTVSAIYNGVTVTAALTVLPAPPPLVLTSLSLDRAGAFGSPVDTSVNLAVGTVAFNTPPIGGAIAVTVTSSNPALAVLSSPTVMVGPGQNTGTFIVTAPQPVAIDTPVTITATYQGITMTATLTILAPQDRVTINKAEYDSAKQVILVEASSSIASAHLAVWDSDSGQFLFWLQPTGGGKSSIQTPFPSVQYPFAVPANITVRSTFGGIGSGATAVK